MARNSPEAVQETATDSQSPSAPHRQSPPSNTTAASSESTVMTSLPDLVARDLLPLFNCPQCSPLAVLIAPTTLKCGHSICAEHVTLPRSPASPPASSARPGPHILPACPLPTCRPLPPSSSFLRPNIPSESPVSYFPPQPIPDVASPVAGPSRVTEVRLDVTAGKVLSLLQRAVQSEQDEDPDRVPLPAPHPSDDDSESDSSPEPPETSTQPRRLARSRSSRRPNKRMRTDDPSADPHSDLPIGKLQKELLSELTCEICFMLLYQPVTTPCQHVCPFFAYFFWAHPSS